MIDAAKWGDLRVRLLSGLVVLAVGLGAVLAGGPAIKALAVAAAGLMLWELSRLTAPGRPLGAAIVGMSAAGALAAIFHYHGPYWLALLALPALFGAVQPSRDRLIFVTYACAVMLGSYALVGFREGYGLAFTLWLVLVVIASDIMGYFGGRLIGGPKFWPRLSPKKTWSGTAAGWVGAGAVGAAFALAYHQHLAFVIFSALTAFAAQLGDIAESWVKRRAGVKDASALIPGHGGLLDRFDALIGAAVFVIVWGLGLPLPDLGG